MKGWYGEREQHSLASKGIRSKIYDKFSKPKMGQCHEVNSYAYKLMKENNKNLKLVGGEAYISEEITIVDDNGNIGEVNSIEHVWIEDNGKIIDYAKAILRPIRIVKYEPEAILDEECNVLEWIR